MSTILVAAIIIAIAVIPAAIFSRLHKQRERKRLESLLDHFKDASVKHNLLFTHQEMLKDKMLGLDSHEQKLLVFTFDKEHTEVVIDLADVEVCTVYKEFDTLVMNDKKEAKGDRVLMQIGLNIVFSNTGQSLQIVFYDGRVNAIYEMPELEKKAKEWKGLVANAVTERTSKRA